MMHSLSSASSSTPGLQLLVAAAMILTPQPTLKRSKIPVPCTPKKKHRRAKRCASVLPYIPPLTFDVCGDEKRKWLRLNHRACPNKNKKQKVRSLTFRPRQSKKKLSEDLHFLWSDNDDSL